MIIKPWIEHDKRTGHYTVRWRNAAGKAQRDKGYVWANRTDAKARMRVIAGQEKNNALGVYKKMTLADASVVFREYVGPTLANDHQREACDTYWGQINAQLGSKLLDEIHFKHIVDYWRGFLKRGCKPATANRSIMWICNLYERFYLWNEMVPDYYPQKIALPNKNPVTVAKEAIGKRERSEVPYKRTRRLDLADIRLMRDWCQARNLPEFWYAIRMAILSTLRLSDLARLKPGVPAVGIQAKTQRAFNIPLVPERSINLTNRRRLWDAFRTDVGWYDQASSLHTTWHDLRHCGPSIMGNKGIPQPLIQEFLGQATPAQSKTYTHISQHALLPGLEAIQTELDSL